MVVPAPKLTFKQAGDQWLDQQVSGLRPGTIAIYESAVRLHLNPRWGRRKLDSIKVSDATTLVRELREDGYAEWSIAGVLKAASRVFRFSQRHLNWRGSNPIAELENGERAKVSQTPRRRIFSSDELSQTLKASGENFRTLFVFASITGARLSECLGLVWADLHLSDLDVAEVSFEYQADRKGERHELKTETSRRTIELPRQLAAMLVGHRLRQLGGNEHAFVFATKSGRPLGQRNVLRELRRAMKSATDDYGRPTFSILHERDERGKAIKPQRGAVPNFHSLRHTAASEAIAAARASRRSRGSWGIAARMSRAPSTCRRSGTPRGLPGGAQRWPRAWKQLWKPPIPASPHIRRWSREQMSFSYGRKRHKRVQRGSCPALCKQEVAGSIPAGSTGKFLQMSRFYWRRNGRCDRGSK